MRSSNGQCVQLLLFPFIFFLSLVVGDGELKVETTYKPEDCEKLSEEGDTLTMQYTGRLLKDGTEFDSSYGRPEPFSFQLGRGHVIEGWDKGLRDMCVGEKRTLTVPSHMAYGEAGAGDKIPPHADLIFDVELVRIGSDDPNVFKLIDANQDNLLSREEVSEYLAKQVPEEVKKENNFDQDQLVEEIFTHEDKDKNGFISHEEFSGPKHDEL